MGQAELDERRWPHPAVFLDAQSGPLELCEALRIARDVAHALCHAHAAGVVRREPENLMLDSRGQVKILDFGLARQAGVAPDGDASTFSFAAAEGVGRPALDLLRAM